MCADVDKARRAYHLRYAGYEPMDPEHMDLLLSSTALGIEGTAQALAALIRRRFDEPLPDKSFPFGGTPYENDCICCGRGRASDL